MVRAQQLLFLIFFLFAFYLQGQSVENLYWRKDYNTVDSLALATKRTSNLSKLASGLTSHCSSDLEKYRSIFTWIAHNIAYDVEALADPKKMVVEAEGVVKKGRSVCEGYANLFAELCKYSSLECEVIHGWGRSKEDIGKSTNEKSNHAWNAVKVDGNWYLCDVTWGAGSTREGSSEFTFEFKDQYFCTPPRLFSLNHFPEDEKWLLGERLTKKEFDSRPHFYQRAIDSNVNFVSPDEGTIRYTKGSVIKFRFDVDKPADIVTVLPSNAKTSTRVAFETDGGSVVFDYELRVFSAYLTIFVNGKAFLVYRLVK